MPAHTRSAPCAPAGSRPIEGCRFTGRLRAFSTAPEPSETNAEALRARPRSVTRDCRGTGAGAPSPLRFGAAGHGSGSGRPERRLIGAPTAPPLPCCAVTDRGSARGRGRRDAPRPQPAQVQAAPARSHSSRTFVTPRNMKRRRAIACLLAACRRKTCGTWAGPNSAAGRRGRRRSAYEAPRAAAEGGPRFGGAESKRRRRPRLPAPPSRVTLLGRLRRPAATAPRLGAGRAARTAAPAPPPAALRGPGPTDAAQEIPDLLAEFLAHELPNRGHQALLSWHPVPSRLRFGCSYSNAPSRARRARWLRGEVFPLQMERIRFHEFQSSRALPHFQNSFEWTDDISRYTVNVLVQRREWLGTVRLGMRFLLFQPLLHPHTGGQRGEQRVANLRCHATRKCLGSKREFRRFDHPVALDDEPQLPAALAERPRERHGERFRRQEDLMGAGREERLQALAERSRRERDVAAEHAPRVLPAAGQEPGHEGAQRPLRALDHELVPCGHDRPLTRRRPKSPARTRESRRATSSAECTRRTTASALPPLPRLTSP